MKITSPEQLCPRQWKKTMSSGESKTNLMHFLAEEWASDRHAEKIGDRSLYVTHGCDCTLHCTCSLFSTVYDKNTVNTLYLLWIWWKWMFIDLWDEICPLDTECSCCDYKKFRYINTQEPEARNIYTTSQADSATTTSAVITSILLFITFCLLGFNYWI